GFGGRHAFALSALLSSVMLQAWTPLAQAWNGPSWSLSVEAFFYLVFPWIGFRLVKKSQPWTLISLLFCWLVPSGLAIAYVTGAIPAPIWLAYATNNPLLWLPLFVMGICASPYISSLRKLDSDRANLLTVAAFVSLICVSLAWPAKWADVFVTGGIAPLLLVVIVCCTRTGTWPALALDSPWLNKLGEASYAIYILQAPLWHSWQPFTNYLRRAPLQTNVVALWQFAGFVV